MNSTRVVSTIIRRVSSDNLLLQICTKNSSNSSPRLHRPVPIVQSVHLRNMSECTPSTSSGTHPENRLALEKSPYLLQHASNPVDWYPWGEEAFEKARNENKLIFLSVGYSTCHWCHVMEKESFENESVAEIMNKYYVNVKVDREERPDIDRVYMSFIQATSGGGGWPMSVFLTPNLEPITGGTYFPPEDKWGRPGFKTILKNIAERWQVEKNSIQESGRHIVEILRRATEKTSENTEIPSLKSVDRCLQQFSKSYDSEFGGFSGSPKFPQPSNFDFLFHAYSRDKNSVTGQKCLEMCTNTLKKMANGGIHDHVSNGFARYSTDSKWHVPHFEKMLYDQGQLTVAYCNAYLATKDDFYAEIVRDILKYVSRDLSHESGGFYSAEDADSLPNSQSRQKKEGAFCVWEYDEILSNLTTKTDNISDAEIFCYHFNVRKNGNVHPSQDPHNELTNKNILIIFGNLETTSEFFELPVEKIKDSLDKSLKKLYEIRQQRPRPHLDTKILTSWNGLMITGFAKAGEILNDDIYTQRAIKAANFIKENLYIDGEKTLLRCCYKSDTGNICQISSPIVGFLDDYAFLIRSLIDLYENTLDASWLLWAEDLQETQDRLFWDDTNAGYFTSPLGDPSVLIRVKDDQDGAEPSGNSVSCLNLIKLSAYLDRSEWKSKAEKILSAFGDRLEKIPIALPEMMTALMMYHDELTNVLMTGPRDSPATTALLQVVRGRLLPNRTIVLACSTDGPSAPLYSRLTVLKSLKMIQGQPAAYVCRHHACSLPVILPGQLDLLLDSQK